MRTIETANPDKLYGIFGDAQWTNKDRLSDAMLRDLVEHFSTLELAVANLPEDELGQGYEYLIKKFADDAGHTAAEFYTNRTVVLLMSEILKPQPSESIYDPTCGSGGMLLSCITHLRRQGQEWRNVRLYGQERNLMTSSIARMNCFLHGIEDFQIARGDTLSGPKFVQRDRLMRFDLVLANPPYSIKQWDRDAFASDPWGRNLFGTPPQGRAFWQHILCSLAPKTGRCAILFPHGVLFRQEEEDMRRKLIETDTVECVLGLGPNLFYNAAMEACVVICRTSKPKARKGRILFINAVNEVTRERAQSFLTEDHIEHIADAYDSFKDQPGLAKVTALEEVRKNGHSLKIDLYVATPCASNGKGVASTQGNEFTDAVAAWGKSRTEVRDALSSALSDLKMAAYRGDALRLTPQADIRRHFDHKKWTRARFGDVVSFVKQSVDPNSGELDRYVAGDHMETDNVHIRRWGIVGEGYLGPAFIRRFRKGQVLYGSRRTYLKKVAYAEFDGITADTTFVLEGVDGKLHQPLLPWLMLSQRFTKHSVRESKGSTNPYINFPDIATFEIDLPPLDQQRRMAEIRWAVDEVVMKTAAASEDSSRVVDAELNSFLYKSSNWRIAECRELLVEGPRNGFRIWSSGVSSITRIRSFSGIELASIRKSVVFPVPVPPLMSSVFRCEFAPPRGLQSPASVCREQSDHRPCNCGW
jgi:type I restriction enzyme M protein